jgi:hypothetical protein
MITTIDNHSTFQVTGETPQILERDLNAAVGLAELKAKEGATCGVLVTRHGTASFTVTVTSAVPYGMTEEGHDYPDRNRA